MRFLFFDEPTYLDYLNNNYWWPVILCVIIVAVGFYFIYFYKPKSKVKGLTDEEIRAIINLFGGVENIKEVKKDGSRFSYSLVSVEKCDLEGIKGLGATGIFVSGSTVKLIFPFDADVVMEKANH
jgi:phosphotransferase system IIB component